MSIIIKGMEMPSCCAECDFCGGFIMPDGIYTCDCPTAQSLNITRAIDEDCRHPHCPLVPVPKHGRLIDADVAEVIHFTEEDAGGKDFYDGILYAADFISQQSTIIPADEGE